MARRWRVRRVVKWLATIVSCVLVGAGVANIHWKAYYRMEHCELAVYCGAVFFFWLTKVFMTHGRAFMCVGTKPHRLP